MWPHTSPSTKGKLPAEKIMSETVSNWTKEDTQTDKQTNIKYTKQTNRHNDRNANYLKRLKLRPNNSYKKLSNKQVYFNLKSYEVKK